MKIKLLLNGQEKTLALATVWLLFLTGFLLVVGGLLLYKIAPENVQLSIPAAGLKDGVRTVTLRALSPGKLKEVYYKGTSRAEVKEGILTSSWTMPDELAGKDFIVEICTTSTGQQTVQCFTDVKKSSYTHPPHVAGASTDVLVSCPYYVSRAKPSKIANLLGLNAIDLESRVYCGDGGIGDNASSDFTPYSKIDTIAATGLGGVSHQTGVLTVRDGELVTVSFEDFLNSIEPSTPQSTTSPQVVFQTTPTQSAIPQTLALSGNTLSLSGGNSVTLTSPPTYSLASSTMSGLLSNTDWSIFAAKENSLMFDTNFIRTGDSISLMSCAAGQVMKSSGASWVCANDIGAGGGSYSAGTGISIDVFNAINNTGTLGVTATGALASSGGQNPAISLSTSSDFTQLAGQLALSNTGVSAGIYNNLTVNAQGRVTAATNVSYLTTEGDSVVGNEVAGVVTGGGLVLSGSGTSASPYKVGLVTTCAAGQLMKWNGSSWACAADIDTDTNTDAQALSYNPTTNVLSLVSGGSIDLSALKDNTDSQSISRTGHTISITGSSSTVDLTPYIDNTDSQTLTITNPSAGNHTISISGGNGQSWTESQALSYNTGTRTISLTNGGSVVLPADQDTTYTAGNGLALSSGAFTINASTCSGTDKLQWNGSGFVCTTDVDTNTDAQTLSWDGGTRTLSISGSGSSVVIPGSTGGGTVTGVTAGTGLTGGTITTSGTIALASSGVTAGTYGSAAAIPVLAVDQYGRITSASTAALPTANTTTTGVLTDTDWDIFNGKENVLTFSDGLVRATNSVTLMDCAANQILQRNGADTAWLCANQVIDSNTTYSAGTGLSLTETTFANTGVLSVTASGALTSSGGQNPAISLTTTSDLQQVSNQLGLVNTGVTAGTYNGLTVDAKGRVTAATQMNYLTAEGDSIVGNEVAGVITNGGLVMSGAGTSVNPYKLGLITSCVDGQLLKYTTASGWSCASDTDTQLNESQVDTFVANNGYLTAEADGSTINELQTLSWNTGTNTISLSGGGGSVNLSALAADNDTQALSWVAGTRTLSLTNGGSVVIGDSDTTYSNGNGLSLTSTVFAISAPTCTGSTAKLLWSGTTFTCGTDVDTNTTYGAGSGLNLSDTTFSLAQNGATNGQVLMWNTVSGSWLPTTPTSFSDTDQQNLSYNSETRVLSIDRGTGVTFPLADGTETDPGLLSQTDWNTFSGKENVLSFAGNGLFSRTSDTITGATCSTTGHLMKWNGSSFACAADTDTNTTYTASGGVTLSGTDFILTNDFGASIDSGEITDGTVANADLASGSVSSSNIIDSTIVSTDLANGAVTTGKIASCVSNGQILKYYATDPDGAGPLAVGWNCDIDIDTNTDAVSSVFGRSGAVTAQSGDYNAAKITNTPNGSIAASDVQAALNELDSEKLGLTLASGKMWVGNGSGNAAAVSMNGDATMDNLGAITIAANAVALGTDTTGNYAAGVSAGNGITVTGTAGEGWSPTIAVNAPTCSGGQYLSWSGSVFSCATPADTTNFNILANGAGSQSISAGNNVNFQNGTGTTASVDASKNVSFGLTNTGVSAASYAPANNANGSLTLPQFTVDAQGRLTAASTTSVTLSGIANSQLVNSAVTLNASGPLSTTSSSISLGGSATLSLNLSAAGDAVSVTTSSGSGLEVSSNKLGLLRGCSNGQLLKWDSTNKQWACASDADTNSGGTVTSVTSGNAPIVIGGSAAAPTVGLNTSGVTASTYGSSTSVPVITVDTYGRITSASSATIPTADTATTGLLSAANWNTFNAKENVLTFIGNGLFSRTSNTITGISGSSNGQVLKWNGTSWAAATDSDTTYTNGNGLSLSTNSFSINAPTCSANNYLTWNGSAFSCGVPTDTNTTNFNISANGSGSQNVAAGNTVNFQNGTGTTASVDASKNVSFGLTNVGTAGTYGSATSVPVITTDAQGRVTGVTNTAISFPSEVDGVIGNEVTNATTNGGLVRSGSGTSGSPYTLGLITSCSDQQVLKFTLGTSTWACANDSGGTAYTASNGVTLTSNNFTLTNDFGASIDSGEITDGTIAATDLANSGVTAASYAPADNTNGSLALPQFTVNAKGQLTAASTTNITLTGIANSQLANSTVTVTAGSGLTNGGLVSLGGITTLNIGAGNGITVNADDISVRVATSGDALSATTSSGSGLEVLASGLTLIQGCANNEILKWNETTDVWACATDTAGGVTDGDKGDITVSGSGAAWVIDADSVALGTDTTGNYVSNVSAGDGMSVSGTAGEGWSPTVALMDCAANQILQRNPGDTAWICASQVVDTNTTYSAGTGITLTSTTFSLTNDFGTSIDSSEITDGTIAATDLANSGVTAASYAPTNNANGSLALPQFTVNAKGQLTAASTTNITLTGIANSQLANSAVTITAGGGLLNGGAVSLGGTVALNIGAGGGITVNADDIAVQLAAAADALSTTTSSGSGLEIVGTGLALLQGCSDTQVLKWNETTDVWACGTDLSGGGSLTIGTIDSQTKSANGVVVNSGVLYMQSADASFPGLVTTGTQTFAGNKSFTGSTTLGDASGDGLTINSNSISIPNNLNFDSNTLMIDSANNRVGLGTAAPVATLDNAGSTVFRALAVGDASSNGTIGGLAASTSVDIYTTFNVTQTTANLTLTLPTPTDTTAGRIAYVNNIGSVGFGLYGDRLEGGQSRQYMWDGSTWETIGDTAALDRIDIRKSANETVTNSTALQADDQLTFAVGANETWTFQVSYTYTTNNNATPDIKVGATVPAGATCVIGVNDIAHAGNIANSPACATGFSVATTATGQRSGIMTGSVTTGATAGSVTFAWAQATVDATNGTTVIAGSTLIANRVRGADYAETYYSRSGSIAPGFIVSQDGAGVSQIKIATDGTGVLGIVSTYPGQIVGSADGVGAPVNVALAGRVPVKLTTENGLGRAGDMITLSKTRAGYGMVATQSGWIVGQLMQDAKDNGDGTAEGYVYIRHGQWQAPVNFDLSGVFGTTGAISVDGSGQQLADIGVNQQLVAANTTYSGFDQAIIDQIVDGFKNQQAQIADVRNRVAQLDQATLQQAVWNGGIVTNDTTFNGLVTFNSNVVFNGNNAGSVTIPAGQTSAVVAFKSSQPGIPRVVATPQSFVDIPWRVTDITAAGFTIELQQAQTEAVKLDWHAFTSK